MPRKNRPAPTVFVRKHSDKRYVRRSEVERALRGADAKSFEDAIPAKARQAFLEQDFTKGRGKDDKALLKTNFGKFDGEIIKRAAEGRDE